MSKAGRLAKTRDRAESGAKDFGGFSVKSSLRLSGCNQQVNHTPALVKIQNPKTEKAMRQIIRGLFLLCLIATLMLAACATTEFTPEGRAVRSISAGVAQTCQHMGMASSWKPALDGGLSAAAVAVWFHRLYSGLGMIGCSSHSGRRTFITKAARKIGEVGGSLRDVQQLAGHSSLSTTARYIEADAEAQRKLVALI